MHFAAEKPERVIHLAAQAGVRYSLDHPHAYVDANITGFLHVLEGCRHHGVGHLVFASSSRSMARTGSCPSSVSDNVDHPVSLYGATKKANELMAHTYAHLFGLPVTGFASLLSMGLGDARHVAVRLHPQHFEGKPIEVFNYGHHARDFTYIDDIVEGVVRTLDRVAAPDPNWDAEAPDPATSSAPYRIYNIGNHSPVQLLDYIAVIEKEVGKKAVMEIVPAQPGDVPETYADVDALTNGHWLYARDSDRGRGQALRRLVSRLLSRVKFLTFSTSSATTASRRAMSSGLDRR